MLLYSEALAGSRGAVGADSWSWQGWGRVQACVGYIRESNSPDFLPPVVLAVFAGGIEIYSIEEKYSLWGQLALPEQKSKL